MIVGKRNWKTYRKNEWNTNLVEKLYRDYYGWSSSDGKVTTDEDLKAIVKHYGATFNQDNDVFEKVKVLMGNSGWKFLKHYAKGGNIESENAEMVKSYNKQIAHHTKEMKGAMDKKSKVPAWVVAKMTRSASDLSDATHYMEGKGEEYAKGGDTIFMQGGVMGDISSIKDTEQFRQLITVYNELSEKFGVSNYFIDHKDNSVIFLMESNNKTADLNSYVNSLHQRGFDIFDKTQDVSVKKDNGKNSKYYFKLNLSKKMEWGGTAESSETGTPIGGENQSSMFGKGGSTSSFEYTIGGL